MLAVSGPREKHLSWGGMQAWGARCRSSFRQELGAVLSAGGIKIVIRVCSVGQGEHSVVAHQPPHEAGAH